MRTCELAFWYWPCPENSDHAVQIVEHLSVDVGWEPSPLLASFVAELTARFPDLDENGNGVWDSCPLASLIRGNLLRLGIRERIDEVVTFAKDRALAYHLNVLDVRTERLLVHIDHDH